MSTVHTYKAEIYVKNIRKNSCRTRIRTRNQLKSTVGSGSEKLFRIHNNTGYRVVNTQKYVNDIDISSRHC